jgi:hypothetical protein
MYVFGGKNLQGDPTNTFFNISIVSSPIRLEPFETVGIPPRPRFGHAALFLSKLDYYVIYGGRDDRQYSTSGSCAMSDINVLDLRYFAWCQVKLGGSMKPPPSYNFAYASDSSQIFRFGGVDDGYFNPANMCVLELDQDVAYSLHSNEARMKKILNQQLDSIKMKGIKGDTKAKKILDKYASIIDDKLLGKITGNAFVQARINPSVDVNSYMPMPTRLDLSKLLESSTNL